MIRLIRLPLNEAVTTLKTLTGMVAGIAANDRVEKARQLFSDKNTTDFNEIRTTLKWMNGGSERCMYCQANEANAIDHFDPLSRNPLKAFNWDNYLWACVICNSNNKRAKFPLKGDTPLLINPVTDEPNEFLSLGSSGLFSLSMLKDPANETLEEELKRLKYNETIEIFGLNKREALITDRKYAWSTLPCLLNIYHQDKIKRPEIKKSIQAYPVLQQALYYMWKIYTSSDSRNNLIGNKTVLAFEACPEIGTWFLPEVRGKKAVKDVLDKLVGLKVTALDNPQDTQQHPLLRFENECLSLEGYICQDSKEKVVSFDRLVNKKLANVRLEQAQVTLHFHGLRLSKHFANL